MHEATNPPEFFDGFCNGLPFVILIPDVEYARENLEQDMGNRRPRLRRDGSSSDPKIRQSAIPPPNNGFIGRRRCRCVGRRFDQGSCLKVDAKLEEVGAATSEVDESVDRDPGRGSALCIA